jgi:hypothetical protein
MPATLSPGTYYIKITEYQNDGTIGSYTLRATWTDIPIGGGITADAYEADNTPTDARVITSGQTQNRNIHLAGNVDWARFTVGVNGASNVVVETDGPSGDTQMWLYGPNNTAQQVQGGYSDDEGNGAFSRLACGANGMPATLSPGTYYIKITEYQNDGTIAAYTLRASWTDLPSTTILPDSYEADDSAAAAKVINNGQTQTRNIHAVGNVDWIRLTVGGGGGHNLVIETDGPSGDTQMWLYGPNNSTALVPGGYNDDKPGSGFSRLTAGVNGMSATLQPGTYFIKVQEYLNDGTIPAYTLRASWTETSVVPVTVDSQTPLRVNMSTGQERWLQFTLTSRRAVYLDTSTLELDTTMHLYRDAQAQSLVAMDYDSGIGYSAKISGRVLDPGTYYVRITLGTQTRNTNGAFDFRVYTGLPAAATLIDWEGLQQFSDTLYVAFQVTGAGFTKLAMAQMTSDAALMDTAKSDLTSARRIVAVLLRDPALDLSVSGGASFGISDAAGVGSVDLGMEGSVNFLPGLITGPNQELGLYLSLSGSAGFGGVYNTQAAKVGLLFEDEGIVELHDWYGPAPDFWSAILRGIVDATPGVNVLNVIRMADAATVEGSVEAGFGDIRLPYGNGLECSLGAGTAGTFDLYIEQIWNGIGGIGSALANAIQGNSNSMKDALNDLLSSNLYDISGKAYAVGSVGGSAGVPIPVCPIVGAKVEVSAGVELAFSTKAGSSQGPLMQALNGSLVNWLDQ